MARKNQSEAKPKRPPSAYNLFVAEKIRSGMTMSQAASAWNQMKYETENENRRRCYMSALEILEEEALRAKVRMEEAAHREKVLEFKKNTKARIIQKQWREAISNPTYRLCKDRLMNEFST